MKNLQKNFGVGIIGAGLIGAKRAEAIAKTGYGKLLAVADPDIQRATSLAKKYGAEAVGDWKKIIASNDISVIAAAVPNVFVKQIVIAAVRAGKHVLCEKPFGRNAKESREMVIAAKKAQRLIKVGFNHRFHPGIEKAHKIYERCGIGKVMLVRARYGHGGRPGMEKEWRFDKKISGGGELLDQGAHIIDLARWFCGEFDIAYGLAQTKFWDTKLDDNAFALLRNKKTTVSLHVSTTNWKNIFSFEIFGDTGYLQIDGKGGSYGEEVLTYGKRNPGAAPDIKVFKFGGRDISWEREWEHFSKELLAGSPKEAKLLGDAADGLRANQMVEAIYKSSREHREVKLPKK
jgi:predicted dehydrogenase